ncbi:MAG TPA: hypothetical protein PKI19_08865 [Elusimicrobiales bacterium]|mgnify:CR=1 FL=1|nr:hypothetical protein [Elusimicrobiales bacterium]
MRKALAVIFAVFACGAGLNAQEQLAAPSTSYNEVPEEVVIKGESEDRIRTARPEMAIKADSLEILRRSLGPEKDLFLFESGDFLSLSRSYPDKLFSAEVVQPWRAGFSDKTVIAFYPFSKFEGAFGKDYDAKLGKDAQWTLSITDEAGKLFHKYSGAGAPPETINWTGENDRKEWIRAGRSYAPVYKFTDGRGVSKTVMGELIKYNALVYQKDNNLVISLDSILLFGPAKSLKTIEKPGGEGMLAATADLIKRRYYNLPVKVNVYAGTRELAGLQAGLIKNFLKGELMAVDSAISGEGFDESFAQQRIDIVLLTK